MDKWKRDLKTTFGAWMRACGCVCLCVYAKCKTVLVSHFQSYVFTVVLLLLCLFATNTTATVSCWFSFPRIAIVGCPCATCVARECHTLTDSLFSCVLISFLIQMYHVSVTVSSSSSSSSRQPQASQSVYVRHYIFSISIFFFSFSFLFTHAFCGVACARAYTRSNEAVIKFRCCVFIFNREQFNSTRATFSYRRDATPIAKQTGEQAASITATRPKRRFNIHICVSVSSYDIVYNSSAKRRISDWWKIYEKWERKEVATRDWNVSLLSLFAGIYVRWAGTTFEQQQMSLNISKANIFGIFNVLVQHPAAWPGSLSSTSTNRHGVTGT